MIVRTQAELDQALADGASWIEIGSEREVNAYGSATVRASGSATVRASGSATVNAYDSATVRAYGSATVTASGSATVRASGSATVRASGSATVRASGSATVNAYESATVNAYDSATVRAGSHTAVHRHSPHVCIEGGVLIDHVGVDKFDGITWADYHGAAVSDGLVTVYKAVRSDLRSAHGALYEIGSEVSCNDWADTDACGGGLHFSPSPAQASEYDWEATRWLECTVRVDELRVITGGYVPKLKAPRARVVREVTHR